MVAKEKKILVRTLVKVHIFYAFVQVKIACGLQKSLLSLSYFLKFFPLISFFFQTILVCIIPC